MGSIPVEASCFIFEISTGRLTRVCLGQAQKLGASAKSVEFEFSYHDVTTFN